MKNLKLYLFNLFILNYIFIVCNLIKHSKNIVLLIERNPSKSLNQINSELFQAISLSCSESYENQCSMCITVPNQGHQALQAH